MKDSPADVCPPSIRGGIALFTNFAIPRTIVPDLAKFPRVPGKFRKARSLRLSGRPHVQYKTGRAGVSTVEFALLVPLLFVAFGATLQFVIAMQSAIVANYASFAAARAFEVYGDRKLSEIEYPYTRSEPLTNPDQTIAEAAAEKVTFESLIWENTRIQADALGAERYYEDGNHVQYDGGGQGHTTGAVQVNFVGCQGQGCATGTALEVLYCMPIVFPGARALFASSKKEWPCKVSAFGRSYEGIGLVKRSYFKREPLEK